MLFPRSAIPSSRRLDDRAGLATARPTARADRPPARRRWCIGLYLATAGAVLLAPGPLCAQGVDRVKTKSTTISGQLIEWSPTRVTIRRSGGREVSVPVQQIESIALAGEPKELSVARAHLAAGRIEDAAKQLAAIEPSASRRALVEEEIEFYRALAAARQALAGTGSVDNAGKAMFRFVTRHAESYHYFQACELLADLLVARKKFDRAEPYLGKVASAPWPEMKIRGDLKLGKALLAQEKLAEAKAAFARAASIDVREGAALDDRTEAQLYGALLAAKEGDVDRALEQIRARIAKIDENNRHLLGRAYVVLGNVYLQADRPKDALLAFLHVDLLYNVDAEAHAEALAHLASLWKSLGKPQRARQARQLLDQRYANSRWAN